MTYKKDIGRLNFWFRCQSSKAWMGRFGGGWDWKLCISVGTRAVHVALLLFEFTLKWRSPVTDLCTYQQTTGPLR